MRDPTQENSTGKQNRCGDRLAELDDGYNQEHGFGCRHRDPDFLPEAGAGDVALELHLGGNDGRGEFWNRDYWHLRTGASATA